MLDSQGMCACVRSLPSDRLDKELVAEVLIVMSVTCEMGLFVKLSALGSNTSPSNDNEQDYPLIITFEIRAITSNSRFKYRTCRH